MNTRILAVMALAGAAALGGCGKMGPLERPGPLFSDKTLAPADRTPQDPSRPVTTVDPRDRTTDLAPARSLPIEGSGQNPIGSGPPGVLPDPYANPGQ